MVSEPTLAVTWARAGQGRRRMAHGACGPVADTRHGICAGTERTYMCQERRSLSFAPVWVCLSDEDVGSFEGGVCDTPAHNGPYMCVYMRMWVSPTLLV